MIKSDAQRRVLIVDESDESREVLRTILERRGVEIVEAVEGRQGLTLAGSCSPDLIVLDLETLPGEDVELRDQYDRQSKSNCTPMLLLGTVPASDATSSQGSVMAKPYHYGPLLRTIEDMLRVVEP
ncbi:MAG: response regulator [Pirellulaceae bacterium]|nr:response regulator [Pirellulaceae bacterium]